MNATDSHRPNQPAGLPPAADAHVPWPPTPTPEQERAWREPSRPAGQGAGVHAGAHTHPEFAAQLQEPLPAPASVQTLATWALVLGIVSVFFNPFAGVSIAAGACAIVALNRSGKLQRAGVAVRGHGLAIAGLVLAIVGFARTAGFGFFLI